MPQTPRPHLQFHGGLDVIPVGGGFGTELLAPGDIQVLGGGTAGGYGDFLIYSPVNNPDAVILHAHTRILPRIDPGMTVPGGTPIGVLTKSGGITGAHTHVEFWYHGRRRDPSAIFQ